MDNETPKTPFLPEYIKIVLGTIGFILICVTGFWLSSLISVELQPPKRNWPELAAILAAGLSLAFFVMFFASSLEFMGHLRLREMSKCMK